MGNECAPHHRTKAICNRITSESDSHSVNSKNCWKDARTNKQFMDEGQEKLDELFEKPAYPTQDSVEGKTEITDKEGTEVQIKKISGTAPENPDLVEKQLTQKITASAH